MWLNGLAPPPLLMEASSYLDPGSAGQLGDPLPTHGGGPTPVSPLHMESGKDPLCQWQIQQQCSGPSPMEQKVSVSRGELSRVLSSEVLLNGITRKAREASLPAGLTIFVLVQIDSRFNLSTKTLHSSIL